jgi:hypothetical protein
VDWSIALRPLLDDRPEFLSRRHGLGSHEHMMMSSKSSPHSVIYHSTRLIFCE